MQIKWVEVSEEELEAQRAAFANGQLALETEEAPFDLAAYNTFLKKVAPEARAFQAQQQAAAAKQARSDGSSSPPCDGPRLGLLRYVSSEEITKITGIQCKGGSISLVTFCKACANAVLQVFGVAALALAHC